eukprot:4398247-Alexandrium_andersonii.AAC.1
MCIRDSPKSAGVFFFPEITREFFHPAWQNNPEMVDAEHLLDGGPELIATVAPAPDSSMLPDRGADAPMGEEIT